MDPREYAAQMLSNDSFESFEENLENLVATRQITRSQAANIKKLAAKSNVGAPYLQAAGNDAFKNAKAIINIRVKRESANIALDLPYVVFAAQLVDCNYLGALTLPTGVTCAVTVDGATGDVLFTFTQGMASDVVRVSCLEAPYIAVLRGMVSEAWATRYLKGQTSDTTNATAQFSLPLKKLVRSVFGTNDENSLPIATSKTANQNQADVREMPLTFGVDKETGLTNSIVSVASYIVTWSFTLDGVQRFDASRFK